MADLFSPAWMARFVEEWNKDPELSDALAQIGFNSVIAYGYPEEDKPRAFLVVQNGKATASGVYTDQPLNWDIRAQHPQWLKWIEKSPGMTGLGMAFTIGKIKFKVGDYASMLKDPRMAGPFVKSFSAMSKI